MGDVQRLTAELYEAIKAEAGADVTSVTIFFNCEGVETSTTTRSPQSLEENGIAMRNIRGEWIKELDNA
jgi:hypothetical protein